MKNTSKKNSGNKNYIASSLARKLGLIKKDIVTKRWGSTQKQTQDTVSLELIDGVHVINMWHNGDTHLGVGLAPSTRTPFTMEFFGEFDSLDCFNNWIRSPSKNDEYRVYHPKHKKGEFEFVDSYRLKIAVAFWKKITQYDYFIDELRASTLPLEMYYETERDGVVTRKRPLWSFWLIPVVEEIRRALKEGVAPDFDYLLDRNETWPEGLDHPIAVIRKDTKDQTTEEHDLDSQPPASYGASDKPWLDSQLNENDEEATIDPFNQVQPQPTYQQCVITAL